MLWFYDIYRKMGCPFTHMKLFFLTPEIIPGYCGISKAFSKHPDMRLISDLIIDRHEV